MWAFFAGILSSIYFIVPFLIVFVVVEAALVEHQRPGLAGVLILVIALLFQMFSETIQPFTWMADNILLTLVLFIAYLGVGTAFAIYKWRSYIKRTMRKVAERATKMFEESSDKFLRYSTPKDNTVEAQREADMRRDDLAREIREEAFYRVTHRSGKQALQVSDHKTQVVAWMAYWPISGLWAIIDDPLARIYFGILNRISGMLQGFSNKEFDQYKDKYK